MSASPQTEPTDAQLEETHCYRCGSENDRASLLCADCAGDSQ